MTMVTVAVMLMLMTRLMATLFFAVMLVVVMLTVLAVFFMAALVVRGLVVVFTHRRIPKRSPAAHFSLPTDRPCDRCRHSTDGDRKCKYFL
jgi:hypothetical protein